MSKFTFSSDDSPLPSLCKTLIALSTMLALSGAMAADMSKAVDTTWLSLEELMGIEISSAAKRPQRLAEASTAIYALGREEILRSGATSLPELLRTVPGV